MVPVGENRDIAEVGQSVTTAVAVATPLRGVAARVEMAYSLARSKVVRGAGARTFVVSAAATMGLPRISFAYVIAGVGGYRSTLSPAPLDVTATSDFGINGGAGLKVRLAALLGRADPSSWRERLDVFLESRLHHILSDVKPTDHLEGIVGMRLRIRSGAGAR